MSEGEKDKEIERLKYKIQLLGIIAQDAYYEGQQNPTQKFIDSRFFDALREFDKR